MSRIILGMAKSAMNLKGAKARGLRLDLLEMIYAVKDIKQSNGDAHGYLCVFNNDIKEQLEIWKYGYKGGSDITIFVPPLTTTEIAQMVKEKSDNNLGNALPGKQNNELSTAVISGTIMEVHLKSEIQRKEPGVIDTKQLMINLSQGNIKAALPLGVDWDFYGVV